MHQEGYLFVCFHTGDCKTSFTILCSFCLDLFLDCDLGVKCLSDLIFCMQLTYLPSFTDLLRML